MKNDESHAKKKLMLLIERTSPVFGEDYIKVIEFHVKNRFHENIWNLLIEKPRRTLDLLAELFGNEENAVMILREIFISVKNNVKSFDLSVDTVVDAIKEDNKKKLVTLINAIYIE